MIRRRFRRPRLSAALTVLGLAAAFGPSARAANPLGLIASAAAGQGGYGTIKGRLVWGGSEAPAKVLVPKGGAEKDKNVCAVAAAIPDNGLAIDPQTKGIKFGIAYLVNPKGENPEAVKTLVEKAPKVAIDQKNCEFLPYATAVHQDQTLVFKSSDPVNHNVHLSPFTNTPFNLILAPNGETEKKLVAERRPIPLTCDIHPWMKGYVMVFNHPFFAVTGTDGSFEIRGVPAGRQNVVVWQTYGYVTAGLARGAPVDVVAGQVSDLGEIKLDPSRVK